MSERLTRRGFLSATGGVLAAGTLVGADVGLSTAPARASASVPFYGLHQAGITTPPQRQTAVLAVDLNPETTRDDVITLLRQWTRTAAALCEGEGDRGDELGGMGPSRLTVNVGFGPTLFVPDRFGLEGRRPIALADLPAFSRDAIAPATKDGDLVVQVCADEPQVVAGAVRRLLRTAARKVTVRWSQSGFNESVVTTGTPRNLLGFKDGTVNPRSTEELDRFVWVGEGQDQQWMVGGTYVVIRRIALDLDAWETRTVREQQRVIGRWKLSGAPMSGHKEFEAVDLSARDPSGELSIAPDAHVRLSSPEMNWGQMLLRRGYSYAEPDAGLLFCAYQENPRLAFVPMYERLSRHDALRHFTTHTASAVAALPPGSPGPGHWLGEALFA